MFNNKDYLRYVNGLPEPKPPKDNGNKAIRYIKNFIVVIVAVILLIGIVVWADKLPEENDDKCNRDWIEQDYNGDGEEDAEDYRIQTADC